MKLYCTLLVLMLLGASCNGNKTKKQLPELNASDLFEKFRKQVVLIKNKSYFKATFSNGTELFFTRVYNNGYSDITFEEQEAIDNAVEMNGTGFFIGKNGLIATNFHVVSGLQLLPSEVDFQLSVTEALQVSKEALENDITYTADRLKRMHPEDSAYLQSLPQAFRFRPMAADPGGEGEEEVITDDTTITSFHERIDSLMEANKTTEALAAQTFQVEIVTVALSVQLEAAAKDATEYPCHIHALSQHKQVDLAIIQMDSKQTPAGVGPLTDLGKENDEEHYGTTLQENAVLKVTTPLYLIGYNYGKKIAATSDGIKVQLSKGEVTQESDQYRVLYSVPMLPGSSGSPVFNNKGQIVAINYCGFTTKDNFNYGILSTHLKYMLEHEPVTTLP